LLAGRLSRDGHSVVLIDQAENAFFNLSNEFSGFKITGDASEHTVLERAEIVKADALFALCGKDTHNLMIAQIARHVFEVPDVFARVYQVDYEDIFKPLGIEIINPTRLALKVCLASLQTGPDTQKDDRT
jgi:trk system potassium uptake protein TrkA